MFLALADVATAATVYGPDESLFRALNLAGTNPALDLLLAFFSALALPYVLPFLVVPLWWRGHRELAFDLLVLLGAVIVVTEVLKYVVDRPRPCDVLPNVNLLYPGACGAEGDPSFPSGHASRIFAVAMLLALRFRWPTRAVAFGVAAMSGLARIYLGLHWPSDVLGGAALGMAFAALLVVLGSRWPFYANLRKRIVSGVSRALRAKPRA